MDIGYNKSKDCKGGDAQRQQHDLHYNKRLKNRRSKEKNRRKMNKLNRRK